MGSNPFLSTQLKIKYFMLKIPTLKTIQNKKPKASLYNKIIGSITKKGKKSLAKKALNHSLYLTSKLYNITSSKILTKTLNQISCYAEIRKVVRRKNVNLIPFPVNKTRQRFLKIKWFLHGVKLNKSKTSFMHKLREEFFKNLETTKYIKAERTLMNNLLIKNTSNAHFRWVSKKR